MMGADDLERRVEAWIRDDIESSDQRELSELLEWLRGEDVGRAEAARSDLMTRFAGPLRFGTAGVRGPVAAGESCMNRATVVRVIAGVAEVLLARVPNAAERGVVLGRDARTGSAGFMEAAAAVLIAKGVRVLPLPDPVPTPVVAFGVRATGAAAGVMVTASHNPGSDNGCKVYWCDGAQIAPPTDQLIAQAVDAQPGAKSIDRASSDEVQAASARPDIVANYLTMVEGVRRVPSASFDDLKVVYTPMHGVGGELFVECCRRQGLLELTCVEEQFVPDPTFPTVEFPNPEEPEAMRLALAKARDVDADLVVAHDPDADRLAVAVSDADGWHTLSGNSVGILLADHLLRNDQPMVSERLVVNTLVSSRLLEVMARETGVRYEETLTGFKHIARAMMAAESRGLRAIFGYEEALGYAVSAAVRDKDGISAGVLILEMAALLKARGQTLMDQLATIHRRFGLWVDRSWSIRSEGLTGRSQMDAQMSRLRAVSPAFLKALGVESVRDLSQASPPVPLLVFELSGGGRISVRPSGTEPKLKFYLEKRMAWPDTISYSEAIVRAQTRLRDLEQRLREAAEGTIS